MFLIRGAVFVIVLACSFVLSGNLDGIEQIRGGISDMVNSFSATVDADVEAPAIGEGEEGIGKYVTPTNLKYLSMIVLVYIGLFRASFFNAIVLLSLIHI